MRSGQKVLMMRLTSTPVGGKEGGGGGRGPPAPDSRRNGRRRNGGRRVMVIDCIITQWIGFVVTITKYLLSICMSARSMVKFS